MYLYEHLFLAVQGSSLSSGGHESVIDLVIDADISRSHSLSQTGLRAGPFRTTRSPCLPFRADRRLLRIPGTGKCWRARWASMVRGELEVTLPSVIVVQSYEWFLSE